MYDETETQEHNLLDEQFALAMAAVGECQDRLKGIAEAVIELDLYRDPRAQLWRVEVLEELRVADFLLQAWINR